MQERIEINNSEIQILDIAEQKLAPTIEIITENPPNEEHPSSNKCNAITTAIRTVGNAGKSVVTSEMTSFICANALYDLLMTIFSGDPSLVANLAKELAKYQIPAVALPVVLIAALRDIKFHGSERTYRLVLSAMSGLGVATFTIPMFMEAYTRIVQIIKNESRSTPVWMSDLAAYSIISGCLLAGILQSSQTYYLKINAVDVNQEKSLLNRITTHPVSLAAFAVVNSASGYHAATFAIMRVLGLDTAASIEYYSRLGITLTAGVAGAIFLARPNPESRVDAKIFNTLLKLAQFSALGINFAETFYLSPQAQAIFGQEVINEQSILWATIVPMIPIIVQLLMLVGLKGPQLTQALLDCLSQTCTSLIDLCQSANNDEKRIPIISEKINYSQLIAASNSPVFTSSPRISEVTDENERQLTIV